MEPSIEGFLQYVMHQKNERAIDHYSELGSPWNSCAIGDYLRSVTKAPNKIFLNSDPVLVPFVEEFEEKGGMVFARLNNHQPDTYGELKEVIREFSINPEGS